MDKKKLRTRKHLSLPSTKLLNTTATKKLLTIENYVHTNSKWTNIIHRLEKRQRKRIKKKKQNTRNKNKLLEEKNNNKN